MNIAAAIAHLFPGALNLRDYRVEDHGTGQVIVLWGLPAPAPTPEQLADAWVVVQARRDAEVALWDARVAMADAWAALPADMRADHAHDYACIEAALIRGDVEAARLRIERVELTPEREQYRAQFISFFPSDV